MRARSTRPSFSALLLAGSLFAAGCASAPQAPPAAAGPTLEASARLCNEATRALFFDQAGVPASDEPVDLVLTPDAIWVLFEPARLLRVERGSGSTELRMLTGDAAEHWTALALDPLDGSLWIAASPFHLKHLTTQQSLETVRLPQILGEGSFTQLGLTRDEIWAHPPLAEHELWRFDRTGKLLGEAFPRSASGEQPVTSGELLLGSLRLELGRDGQLLAWRWSDGAVFAAVGSGDWQPAEEPLLAAAPRFSGIAGTAVGTQHEQWFFPNRVHNLFYLGDEAALLGDATIPAGRGWPQTVVWLRRDGEVKPVLESCAGAGRRGLLAVRADGRGFAGLTDQALIVGSLAAGS